MIQLKRTRHAIGDLLSTDLGKIGFALGVVMPLLAAVLYPLYHHEMTLVWQEWSRLLELPFVACELAIIALARRRGMNTERLVARFAGQHPLTTTMFMTGLFASSLLLSKIPYVSALMSLITVVHLWFGLAIYHLARSADARDWDRFSAWLAIGLVPLALLTAWKFNFPPPRSNAPDGVIRLHAALPGFISVRHFGSWTAGVATAVAARLLFAANRRGEGRWLAGYALAAMLTIWSGTRAGVLAIVVIPPMMALVAGYRTDWPRLAQVGAVSAIATVVAWLCIPANAPEFLLFSAGDTDSAAAMTSGRLELWHSTYRRWLSSPLLGWGTGSTFWEVSLYGWAHTQPHNVLLQFLISWGIVGGLSATFFLMKGGLLLLRARNRHDDLISIFALTLTMLLLSLQEGMLHYPRFIMLSMIGFAAFAARASEAAADPVAEAIPSVRAC